MNKENRHCQYAEYDGETGDFWCYNPDCDYYHEPCEQVLEISHSDEYCPDFDGGDDDEQ